VDTLSLAPSLTHSLTERWSATTSASYLQARYDRTSDPNLVDYDSYGGTLGLSYSLSERASTGLSASYWKYDTSPLTTRSESWALNGNGSYQASEALALTLSLGVQRVFTDQEQELFVCPADPLFCQLGLIPTVRVGVVGRSRQTVFPFSVALKWQISERDTLLASASQQVNPTGAGTVTGSTQAALSYSRALSPVLDFSVSALYATSSLLGGGNIGSFYFVSPNLAWRIDEAWSAGIGYSFTRTTYPDSDQTAQANAVFATLRYAWPLVSKPH
jgi:hypothetical protein